MSALRGDRGDRTAPAIAVRDSGGGDAETPFNVAARASGVWFDTHPGRTFSFTAECCKRACPKSAACVRWFSQPA